MEPCLQLQRSGASQWVVVLLQASKNGATGVELDLEFSADGVPILMHDETVDRTTNGSGSLRRMKWTKLAQLDAAAKHRLRLGRLLQLRS